MDSKFLVNSVFEISTKNIHVLAGQIVSGKINSGMFLSNAPNGISLKISSIEEIQSANAHQNIGLTFKAVNKWELDYLSTLIGTEIILCHE